eukprot:SAG11_NODE_313_length_10878_cov_43.354578_7_plen_212_part_00
MREEKERPNELQSVWVETACCTEAREVARFWKRPRAVASAHRDDGLPDTESGLRGHLKVVACTQPPGGALALVQRDRPRPLGSQVRLRPHHHQHERRVPGAEAAAVAVQLVKAAAVRDVVDQQRPELRPLLPQPAAAAAATALRRLRARRHRTARQRAAAAAGRVAVETGLGVGGRRQLTQAELDVLTVQREPDGRVCARGGRETVGAAVV